MIQVYACRNSPCQNGAICTDTGNSYICTCPPGYSGANCQACKISFFKCFKNKN
jgi:hypothetical protein